MWFEFEVKAKTRSLGFGGMETCHWREVGIVGQSQLSLDRLANVLSFHNHDLQANHAQPEIYVLARNYQELYQAIISVFHHAPALDGTESVSRFSHCLLSLSTVLSLWIVSL
ncbi:hypothetical protein WAI453_006698 [Rhynchosporium graminicola]